MSSPKNLKSSLEVEGEELEHLIRICGEFVTRHVDSLSEQPSADVENAGSVVRAFQEPVPEKGGAIEPLLARLSPAIAKSFTTPGPGYLAFIPGGGLPTAAVADLVACATNRYVGVTAAAPALAQIEATVVDWLASMMGYSEGAGGFLTSGGSLSTLSGIVAARASKLPEDFLKGTLYCSDETHVAVDKAARFAGFPRNRLRRLPADRRGRLRPSDLAKAIVEDRSRGLQPFCLIANVGTTNTGAVDPLPSLLEVARRENLWVHADAAYGGFFRLVDGGAELLPGLEECDSITVDPHKGMFLPYGTGCLLVKDRSVLLEPKNVDPSYLQDVREGIGPTSFTEISPELSRDFRGLRVWLPLQLHGLEVFRHQLQEKLDLARWAYRELREEPWLDMVDEPQLSVVAFVPRPPRGNHRQFGAELLRRVNSRKRVFLSSTTMGGKYVLRICVLSFRTHRDRVEEAVTALREEAHQMLSESSRKKPGSFDDDGHRPG